MAKKRETYVYHDLEFKTKLVMLYLEGNGGYSTLAKAYGLKDGRQLSDWVKNIRTASLLKKIQTGEAHTHF